MSGKSDRREGGGGEWVRWGQAVEGSRVNRERGARGERRKKSSLSMEPRFAPALGRGRE